MLAQTGIILRDGRVILMGLEINHEVVSKLQIVFEGKASIRFESGAYTFVREHFKLNRNAAIGRKMGF